MVVKNWLYYDHNSTHINGILVLNQCLDDQLQFKFQTANSNNDWDTPLILDVTDGVITHGRLSCDRFKMSTGAATNAVLVSDIEGNASWANAENFHDDDWIPITPWGAKVPSSNIYLNEKYSNAGIGTRDPQSKLHVVDGNIMISRSSSDAPGSRNGSILFGKVVDQTCPLGEWGIEYQDDQTTYINGGLNFWKVYNEANPGGDNYLFIKNDGNVGVGTKTPRVKLDVAGSTFVNGDLQVSSLATTEEIQMVTVNQSGLLSKTDIPSGDNLGNHIVTQNINLNGHFLSGNGQDNGLFIAETGKIGFGTTVPLANMDLLAPNSSTLYVRTNAQENASIWVSNQIGSYGMGVENDGSGYIYQNKDNPNKIIYFKDGKVGIGAPPKYSSHSLYVAGGITTEEVKVKVKDNWSDFVFDNDYRLMPLNELQEYVQNFQHLPEIPTAENVKNDGLNLGEMDAALLKKIEELTLYIIQQDKRISELQQKVEVLNVNHNDIRK